LRVRVRIRVKVIVCGGGGLVVSLGVPVQKWGLCVIRRCGVRMQLKEQVQNKLSTEG